MTQHHLTHTIEIDRAPGDVFALLTPEGERRWVPDWEPIYPAEPQDPHAPATVFTTRHGGEEALWVVVEIDYEARRARYVRTNPGSRVALVDVRCSGAGSGSRVEVTYDITALSAEGEAMATEFANGFDIAIGMWKRLIESVLPAGVSLL